MPFYELDVHNMKLCNNLDKFHKLDVEFTKRLISPRSGCYMFTEFQLLAKDTAKAVKLWPELRKRIFLWIKILKKRPEDFTFVKKKKNHFRFCELSPDRTCSTVA